MVEGKNQCRIIIAGNGTGVGKTVVSAIVTAAVQGDYWKPIQCADALDSDTMTMRRLLAYGSGCVYPPAYDLQTPVSPHHAARLQGLEICTENIIPPETKRPLVIESVGGVLVPLNKRELSIDLFSLWQAHWIVVANLYLGSINHTLLTIEALQSRGISKKSISIVFNGASNPDSEAAILHFSQLLCLARLFPEAEISPNAIMRYASQWKGALLSLLKVL